MHTALVRAHRVNLVNDYSLNGSQYVTCPRRRQDEVQRLWSSDQYFRRITHHPRTLCRWCIASPNSDANLRPSRAWGTQCISDPANRFSQVAFNVIVQRTQRRYVQHLNPSRSRIGCAPITRVDCRQECRESLARASRGMYQHVAPALDQRPRTSLRFSRSAVASRKPRRHFRHEAREHRLICLRTCPA